MKNRRTLVILVCLGLLSCASTTSQKKIEKAREKDPQYQYNIGLFYLNSNNVDEAIKYLNKALALNPRHFQSLNALGLAYSMRGNLQEAVNLYQKCLQIAPDFTEAHNNLGTVYQELGFPDRAEEEFKKVVEDQNYTHKELPYYNLARLYFTKQEFEKAHACVNNAIKLNNRFALAYNLLGLILEGQNNLYGALESYKMAVKIVPDDVNFNFNLGAAYFKTDDLGRAAEVLEKIAPQVTDLDMKEKLNSYLKAIKEKEKGGA
jgi:tetratricopeptide (TPR) repeat protein